MVVAKNLGAKFLDCGNTSITHGVVPYRYICSWAGRRAKRPLLNAHGFEEKLFEEILYTFLRYASNVFDLNFLPSSLIQGVH